MTVNFGTIKQTLVKGSLVAIKGHGHNAATTLSKIDPGLTTNRSSYQEDVDDVCETFDTLYSLLTVQIRDTVPEKVLEGLEILKPYIQRLKKGGDLNTEFSTQMNAVIDKHLMPHTD